MWSLPAGPPIVTRPGPHRPQGCLHWWQTRMGRQQPATGLFAVLQLDQLVRHYADDRRGHWFCPTVAAVVAEPEPVALLAADVALAVARNPVTDHHESDVAQARHARTIPPGIPFRVAIERYTQAAFVRPRAATIVAGRHHDPCVAAIPVVGALGENTHKPPRRRQGHVGKSLIDVVVTADDKTVHSCPASC